MKVLYVNEDRHEGILRAVSNPDNINVYVLPKKVEGLTGKIYLADSFTSLYSNGKVSRYNPIYRRKLAKEILHIAEIEKPDLIHFVSADEYLKMGGLTLGILKRYPILITLHWCQNRFIYNALRKVLSQKVSFIIFHSIKAPLYKDKNKQNKSAYLTLPAELKGCTYTREEAKRILEIKTQLPIISMVGTLEKYKGCDLLLDAVKKVNKPFYLIIAGKPKSISEEEIKEVVKHMENVNLKLYYISDECFTQIVCASSYVLVPYRKSFDATSGPLTEAIRCGIPIISTDYGNLGALTKQFKLGYTFEAENVDSLTETITRAVSSQFVISEEFVDYQRRLDTSTYREQQQKIYKSLLVNE